MTEDSEKNLPCGVLLVHKAAGMTSADVIRAIKRQHPEWKFKIGHAGTLDPFATGLLVVLVGRATRLVPFLHEGWKSYEGTILFGRTTDTDDVTGEVLTTRDCSRLHLQTIQDLANTFLGPIEQIPPQYSAVKVHGKRAYERVRQGESVTLQAKSVNVYEFIIRETEDASQYRFFVRTSGGTYIRSLARDLGEKLDCGACLSSLVRTGAQPFLLNEARAVEDLKPDSLLPWWEVCRELPRVELPESDVHSLLLGQQRVLDKLQSTHSSSQGSVSPFLVYSHSRTSHPVGLLKKNEQESWEIAVNFGFLR